MQKLEFAGVTMNVPQYWSFNRSDDLELHYWIGEEGNSDGFLFIRAVPKDFYQSRGSLFLNLDNETYKSVFEMRKKEQLADNMLLMSFVAKKDGWGDAPRPTNVIEVIVMETSDKVLEISLDMSNDYSQNNQDLLGKIYKSIQIVE